MKTLLLVLTLVAFSGCQYEESSNAMEHSKQEEQNKLAVQTVGMPSIKNFTEKKNLKLILEMRDDPNARTYTYTQDMNGKYHKLCDSIGYPIPYSTEYTNPSQVKTTGADGITTIPQADPNGLYSPSSADGTYIMCLNPDTKQVVPIYSEPKLTTSAFELK